jgi:hypothetical protein
MGHTIAILLFYGSRTSTLSLLYTVKKGSRFPVPSWEVNNQTLTGRE